MSRFIRGLTSKLLLLSLLAAGALTPARSDAAGDPCALLSHRQISLNCNAFKGVLGDPSSGLIVTVDASGTYHFQSTVQFANGPADQVEGTCKDRHLVFRRSRPGGLVQEFDGWIFELGNKDYPEMAGVFTHNGARGYSWYGALKPVGSP